MRLAPEGRPFVVGGLAFLAVFGALGWWGSGVWWIPASLWTPVALWMPWFFRDPARPGPRGDHLLLAPADGKVVSVLEVHEPEFLGARATRISTFMNVFDVHVNRHPVNGVVTYRQYRPGAFVNATQERASEANERISLGIQGPRGPVLLRQIAGLVARRVVTDAQVGERVRQGERLGIIRFGSRVDVFVSPGVRVAVQPGVRVRAGVTVLAEWSHD